MKIRAFTLAEVLITLGIIGIVAAMTLPNLIQNYKDKVLINQAKKTYSNFSNVLNLMKADLEVTDYAGIFATGESNSQICEKFAKYYNGAKACISAGGSCGKTYKVKLAKATNNGTGGVSMEPMGFPRLKLADGSFIYFRDLHRDSSGACGFQYTIQKKDEDGFYTGETKVINDSRCATLVIDVNGEEKGPNQYGADVHQILVQQTKLAPIDGSYGALKSIFLRNKLDYETYSENKTFEQKGK